MELSTMHIRVGCVAPCHGATSLAFSSSSSSTALVKPCLGSSSRRQHSSLLCGCGSSNSSRLRTSTGSACCGLADQTNVAPVSRCSISGSSGRQGIGSSATPRAAMHEATTVLEHAAGNGASTFVDRPIHPNDHIGYGSLLENRSFFRERFVVRFSEAGPRGTTTLETFASLLQEAATNHVIAIDYAFTPGKNFDGNITVTTRMHIEVDRYPAWRDLLEVDTWFQADGKNSVRRDWIVKDVKTGQRIAYATSKWVLMNIHTRRLTKITEEKWAELAPHIRYPPMWALSEERQNASSARIAKLGEDAAFQSTGLIASDKDCDMNQHVNNIRYINWMLESIPDDLKSSHEVSKITLEYRQEASAGEAVESLADFEDDAVAQENSGIRQFTHLIRASEAGKEINRGRTVWRPLP